MNFAQRTYILIAISSALCFAKNSSAFPSLKQSNEQNLPAVLKADEIDGDRVTNILTATGNVEVSKGNSIIFADQMTYNKDNKTIRAIGNVKIKNIEVGNMFAKTAEVKDDFSSGTFTDIRMVFLDGSYLSAPEIERKTPFITVLESPIYSLCPNEDIAKDNNLAGQERDFASIKSTETTIDREKSIMKSRNGVMRIYNIPVLYTPYIRIPLPAKKRESGFLSPSYTKSTNLGVGIKIPYYLNIAPNMDLTVTPLLGISSGQILIGNEFRHQTAYGEYKLNFEAANNKIQNNNNTTVTRRSQKEYRWDIDGKGAFDFTQNTGLDFTLNTVGDRDYLRDYHFNYLAYTLSKVNLDYIKGRTYYAAKTIRIQELENNPEAKTSPFILPSLDSHVETRPYFYKEKFALTSNFTSINRESGLQYRRATATPEVKLPFNLRGNLFELDAKVQGDIYWLENNFKYSDRTNNYDNTLFNYKPEISFNWRLPIIKKSKNHTLMIEPMANFVSSTYKSNFNDVPNEDSNNSELTVSNLFVSDRIYGYDRNESGERFNYGLKTSLFNSLGEFGLFLGQGYKKGNTQDVTIRGFSDNNKSNLVGQAMYKATQYFSFIYSFQLSESNYKNDVNQLTASLSFDRFSISTDYLLLRRTQQNAEEKEQLAISSNIKLTDKWRVTLSNNQDLVLGRTLSRGITLYRDGCCTVFGFSAIETNPSNLTKAQRTFNLSLSFKNL